LLVREPLFVNLDTQPKVSYGYVAACLPYISKGSTASWNLTDLT